MHRLWVAVLLLYAVCAQKDQGSNECQNQSDSVKPDPKDCTRYIYCWNNRTYLFKCHDGFTYDRCQQRCVKIILPCLHKSVCQCALNPECVVQPKQIRLNDDTGPPDVSEATIGPDENADASSVSTGAPSSDETVPVTVPAGDAQTTTGAGYLVKVLFSRDKSEVSGGGYGGGSANGDGNNIKSFTVSGGVTMIEPGEETAGVSGVTGEGGESVTGGDAGAASGATTAATGLETGSGSSDETSAATGVSGAEGTTEAGGATGSDTTGEPSLESSSVAAIEDATAETGEAGVSNGVTGETAAASAVSSGETAATVSGETVGATDGLEATTAAGTVEEGSSASPEIEGSAGTTGASLEASSVQGVEDVTGASAGTGSPDDNSVTGVSVGSIEDATGSSVETGATGENGAENLVEATSAATLGETGASEEPITGVTGVSDTSAGVSMVTGAPDEGAGTQTTSAEGISASSLAAEGATGESGAPSGVSEQPAITEVTDGAVQNSVQTYNEAVDGYQQTQEIPSESTIDDESSSTTQETDGYAADEFATSEESTPGITVILIKEATTEAVPATSEIPMSGSTTLSAEGDVTEESDASVSTTPAADETGESVASVSTTPAADETGESVASVSTTPAGGETGESVASVSTTSAADENEEDVSNETGPKVTSGESNDESEAPSGPQFDATSPSTENPSSSSGSMSEVSSDSTSEVSSGSTQEVSSGSTPEVSSGSLDENELSTITEAAQSAATELPTPTDCACEPNDAPSANVREFCAQLTCRNGGKYFTISSGHCGCVCATPYRGAECEHLTDVSQCSCANGGKCMSMRVAKNGIDAFTCECPLGFLGSVCQYSVAEIIVNDSSPTKGTATAGTIDLGRYALCERQDACANSGLCLLDVISKEQRCYCSPGFGGATCSSLVK